MTRRLGLLAALVLLVVMAGWLVASPPDAWRSLFAEESPSARAGEPLPAMPGRPVVRVAVIGDSGTGDEEQQAVADEMAAQNELRPFDGLVILGDLVYPDGDAGLVDERVLAPYAPLLGDRAVLVPALGNHDYQSGEQEQILHRLGRDRAWYLARIGPVRIVVLDSNQVDAEAQADWLASVLDRRSTALGWTLAAMHHPPYSAGYHGSSLDVRDAWVPELAAAEVPLVLAGHEHDYQRTEPIRGVTYVVSGGGGAELRESGTDDFTVVSTSTPHFLDLLVYEDRLLVRAVDTSGRLVDQFTIRR